MTRLVFDARDRAEARSLVTSVRIDANPRHWWISIWNRGGKAGDLCVDAADGQAIVDRLIPPEHQSRTPNPASPAGAA